MRKLFFIILTSLAITSFGQVTTIVNVKCSDPLIGTYIGKAANGDSLFSLVVRQSWLDSMRNAIMVNNQQGGLISTLQTGLSSANSSITLLQFNATGVQNDITLIKADISTLKAGKADQSQVTGIAADVVALKNTKADLAQLAPIATVAAQAAIDAGIANGRVDSIVQNWPENSGGILSTVTLNAGDTLKLAYHGRKIKIATPGKIYVPVLPDGFNCKIVNTTNAVVELKLLSGVTRVTFQNVTTSLTAKYPPVEVVFYPGGVINIR